MSGGSNQGIGLLSRAEEKERSLEHTWITVLGHILSPPGSTGVGEIEFQGSWLHIFSSSSWIDDFEGYIAMLGKCSRD